MEKPGNYLLAVLMMLFMAADAYALGGAVDEKTSYRFDSARSGYVNLDIKPPFELKWFLNTNQTIDYIYSPSITCSIVGDGDTLYFGTLESVFCAFDTSRREFLWRHETEGRVDAAAALFDDRIYFGDTKGYLYCLDKSTGKVFWQRKFNAEILSSPLVTGDRLFFTDMSDVLYCVSRDTGEVIWRKNAENYLSKTIRSVSAPSLNGGLLYQGFSDGYLYCFDADTSKEIFRKKIKDEDELSDVDSPAALDGGNVYAASFDGNFKVLSADSAEVKWDMKINGSGHFSFNDKNIIISSSGGTLYSVDKEFGNITWKRELSPGLTEPVITDDYVFVGSQDYFYAVDITDGGVKYKYAPGSGISSEPCIIGGRVYFLSNKGYLYSLSPR